VLVENYPGFEPIKGFELAQKMIEHAKRVGVKINEGVAIISAKKAGKEFELKTSEQEVIKAKAIILATGAKHKKLNVKGMKEFEGKGISYCATCDGSLFANKKVAVIGGGNSGAVNALYLSKICEHVYLIEYMPELMCEKAYLPKLKEANVEIITNAEVFEFYGKEMLEGLKYRDRATGKSNTLEVSGVFIYIGIEPNNELAKQLTCELNEKGYIKVDTHMNTSVQGVFAAGDITGIFQQIAVACGQGAIAAESAYRYLRALNR
jgi:thioredoxin reductase (NADPH)